MNSVFSPFFRALLLPLLTVVWTVSVEAKPPVEVIAFEAEQIERPQMIEALGHLQANESTEITATVTDTIRAIHFQPGQHVRQSQLLIELNSAEELARLEEAKVRAEEAKRQYQRAKDVEGRGSMTRAMIDQRYREWQTAIAQRKVIEAQVADRRLYAPFAGTLGLTPYSIGALVTPGTEIVTLDNTDTMKLDLLVPSRYLRFLKPGQAVSLKSDAYPDRTFEGELHAISPRLQENVRLVQVRALIDNADGALKANMLVKARLDLPSVPPVGGAQYRPADGGGPRVCLPP